VIRAGLAMLAGILPVAPAAVDAPAAPAVTAPADAPWDAVDRLAARRVAPASGWGELRVRSRENVPGEVETAITLRTPGRVGGAVRWVRVWRDPGPAAGELEVRGILRADRVRASAGAALLRYAGERLGSVLAEALAAATGMIAVGGRMTLYPGTPGLAPQAVAGVYAQATPWMASLELGPGANSFRAAVALVPRPRLVWTASLAAGGAEVGVHYRQGGVEVRVRARSHRRLGTVGVMELVLGGGS
jgi:hypothetical protein